MTMSWSMLRLALTLSAVAAFAPQSVTKQGMRSAQLQQPRELTTLSASSLEESDSGLNELGQLAVDLSLTAMRVGTCALMVHHGIDKIENVDGFSANVVAKFFGFLPGPPQFWTLSAAVTQIVGAGFLSIGLFSRPVAASMSATMITAVIFHLLNTGGEGFPLAVVKAHSYNYELAAMYVVVLGYFTANGAGPISVDEQILGGEIAFYQKLTQGAQDEIDAQQ